MDPDSLIGNRIMGLAYLYKKQYAEAIEYLEFASKLSNYAAFNQVDLINLYTYYRFIGKGKNCDGGFETEIKRREICKLMHYEFCIRFSGRY